MAREPSSVLVTGCSSGFGELTVKTLARAGHHVFAGVRGVASRNADAARRLEDWARRQGARLEVVELDVTDAAAVQRAVERVLAATGRVDVLVNNAGVSAAGPIEAFTMSQIQGLFDVNAFGPIRVSQAVLPSMRARRAGLIVFVTSTLGRVLPGRGGLYPASKWAAEGLAESLRYQVAPFGIDVAILEPGSFPTPAVGKSIVAERWDVTEAYAPASPRPQPPPDQGLTHPEPDPQEVADAIKHLIDLPAGARPLRTVVGPVFTEGVPEYNRLYEQTRDHLAEVLTRPDQATRWARR
jgi:NAD(P)-dependent dehydrogenase (short-subunit alcohol dehydrogenase family)